VKSIDDTKLCSVYSLKPALKVKDLDVPYETPLLFLFLNNVTKLSFDDDVCYSLRLSCYSP